MKDLFGWNLLSRQLVVHFQELAWKTVSQFLEGTLSISHAAILVKITKQNFLWFLDLERLKYQHLEWQCWRLKILVSNNYELLHMKANHRPAESLRLIHKLRLIQKLNLTVLWPHSTFESVSHTKSVSKNRNLNDYLLNFKRQSHGI